jgi:hypothetical protein
VSVEAAGPTYGADRSERLRGHASEIQSSAHDLGDATRALVTELSAAAREQLDQRPYATLVAAGALGCVLGGGLTAGVLRRVFGLGGRVALGIAVRHLLDDAVDGDPSAHTHHAP